MLTEARKLAEKNPRFLDLFKEAGFDVKAIPKYERNVYSSTEVRRRLVKAENWEELVPKAVARYIKSIDGVERLRDLLKSDK